MLNTINLFNRNSYAKDICGNRIIYSAKITRNDANNSISTNLGDEAFGTSTFTPVRVNQDNGRPGWTYPKQRPLQIYRKQYQPENKKSNISTIGVFDKPGLSIQTTKLDKECLDCCNNNLFNQNILNTKNLIHSCNGSSECKFFDPSLNKIVCIACNPENNISRSASTVITENYSYNTNQLLHRRNKTFNQNQLGVHSNILHNSNIVYNTLYIKSGQCCSNKIIVSQNRDSSSSSGRIARLKYETSQNFKHLTPSYKQQVKKVSNNKNQCRNNNLLFRNGMMRLSCPTN